MFFVNVGDYDLKGVLGLWIKVVVMCYVFIKYFEVYFFWYLDQNVFVMNLQLKIEDYIMKMVKLMDFMKKDYFVVLLDSIIKIFFYFIGQDVDFIFMQDKDGLFVGSFIVCNGEWGEFFLDIWFDFIYWSYNFQKVEIYVLVRFVCYNF